jgi:uncharacterized protein (DUF488 family)
LDRQQLGGLLRDAAVDTVIDVRRFPGSRRNPDVGREALEEWLPGCGAAYRWEQRLGGRRRTPPGWDVVDTWWTVPAFQAYASYTRTQDFRDALALVLGAVQQERVAVLCSESVWWRCHRRLIADVAVLGHGLVVSHLFGTGRLQPHVPAAGARVRDDGLLVWDL